MKLLYIAKILVEETDADHGLTMGDIISRLNELGIDAERKSIYRDIAALREIGLNIQTYQRSPVQYGLDSRTFSLVELAFVIDCVQSARFLSDRMSKALTNKIKTLASVGEQQQLDKSLAVEGRIRTQQESVLPSVAIIQQALRENRKICFRYFDYGFDGQKVPRKDEKQYLETPVKLVFSEGNYYALCYNDKHESIVTYRVDRMGRLRVSDEKATRNETTATFDVSHYTNRAFSMYSGKTTSAHLIVHASAMNAVVDRFGTDVVAKPCGDPEGELAEVVAPVMDAPTFYGWVAQFGDKMRISGPKALVDGFKQHLDTVRALYD